MVVAVIGLLATIVLVNMQNSRFKARDANIQSIMHQVRNAAELIYVQSGESYALVCDETDGTLADTGELERLEKSLKKENGNRDVTCFESADWKDFALSSPLVGEVGKHWCVESAGISRQIDNAITGANCE